jgi:hypothetical protein
MKKPNIIAMMIAGTRVMVFFTGTAPHDVGMDVQPAGAVRTASSGVPQAAMFSRKGGEEQHYFHAAFLEMCSSVCVYFLTPGIDAGKHGIAASGMVFLLEVVISKRIIG